MGFGINYEEAKKEFEAIPEGDYEAVISGAHLDMTRGGTDFISVPMTIRNDVEQAQQNRMIFHAIWRKKEPSEADLACGGYSNAQIQTLSKAAGLENGARYENIDAWCNALDGRPVAIRVKHEVYADKLRAKVSALSPTAHPDCRHIAKSSPSPSSSIHAPSISVDDDDLPF